MPRVLLLAGPTASGKTELALRLAELAPVEIISVDATQVYRGLDIGAAKPSREIRARVPHHLIDIRDPSQPYDAGTFVEDATRLAREIEARGRWPLLVGGTMLYFRALQHGLARLPAADPEVRAVIDQEAAVLGWPALHAQLTTVDPVAAARIHPNDPQRIQRALEVFRISGRAISEWQRDTTQPAPLAVHGRWVLCPTDRTALHERIARRLRDMMAAGLLEEVRSLHRRGDLHGDLPALRSVGYRQLWALLEQQDNPDEGALEQAVNAAIAATRQLARRQMTWINADPRWQRLPVDAAHDLDRHARELAHAMAGP